MDLNDIKPKAAARSQWARIAPNRLDGTDRRSNP
jgi:hypothetical protein